MITRIEPGMIHVNDALARQDRRPRRRLRPRDAPEVRDEPRPAGNRRVGDEEHRKLDLVA